MRRGIERQASPSASSFMSSRLPLRISLLNSSGVKGRLGSSSIGYRVRGPNNHRTRLASRRMSIPSRQHQTTTKHIVPAGAIGLQDPTEVSPQKFADRPVYPLTRDQTPARRDAGRSAGKHQRSPAPSDTRLPACTNRRSRHNVRTPHCPRDQNERRSRQNCRRDSPSRRRS